MVSRFLIGTLIVGLLIAGAIAQDQTEEAMPPMGAPEQMKEIAFLEGIWNVDMEWQDEKDPEKWNKEKAVCTYKPVLDGCAMEMKFQGTMMGMPFKGYMLQSYDIDRKQWQVLWVDTYGGRMSFYTGERHGDTLAVSSEEIWQGREYISRMSSFNHTPNSFDWIMESSFDGGKTWIINGKAKYTKKM